MAMAATTPSGMPKKVQMTAFVGRSRNLSLDRTLGLAFDRAVISTTRFCARRRAVDGNATIDDGDTAV